jgi:hypothetical protein
MLQTKVFIKKISFIKKLKIVTVLQIMKLKMLVLFLPKIYLKKTMSYINLQKYVANSIFKIKLTTINFSNLVSIFFSSSLDFLNSLYLFPYCFCIKFYNFYFYSSYIQRNKNLFIYSSIQFFKKLKKIFFLITIKYLYSFIRSY